MREQLPTQLDSASEIARSGLTGGGFWVPGHRSIIRTSGQLGVRAWMSGAACGKLKSSPTLILRPGRVGVGGDGGADFDAGHLHFQPHRDRWQPKAQDAGSATMLVRGE